MTTDQTLQSIADVLAANEQHMVPRDPNQPELHWRDITGLPEPRPVPSPEDRMADTRTDRPTTPIRGLRIFDQETSAAIRPLFDEIDQLRERAEAAEAERDEATEDRDLLRAENANLTAGLRTAQKQRDKAQARVSELLAFIGANESLSRAAELTEELALARRDRDDYREGRDVARQLAAFRQAVIDRHRQELGAAGDVLAVVRDAAERIDRALATYDTTPGETPGEPAGDDQAEEDDLRSPLAAERDKLVETIGRLVSLPPEQIAKMHKVGYSGSAPSSVPSRRAQENRPSPGLHVTRGSGPSDLETGCPCPKEPCGAVDQRRAEWACEHHPAGRAKTMRHMHRADQCPGKPS